MNYEDMGRAMDAIDAEKKTRMENLRAEIRAMQILIGKKQKELTRLEESPCANN